MVKPSSRRSVRKRRDIFLTFVTVLIAAVAMVGAVVAWRVSRASGQAESADAEGLAAALNSASAVISVSTTLSNNLGFFISYRNHLAAAELLDKQASADPVRGALLRQAAVEERNLAATARASVDPDYLELDPADGTESFDGNRYWEAQLASEAALKPLDEKPFFAASDALRRKVRSLSAASVVLGAAVFLLVAAMVFRRRIRYWLAGLGTLAFVLSCAAVILTEVGR
jgi:hypothetical protein